MSKLVKTDREIIPASNIGEAIERALPKEDKLAERGFAYADMLKMIDRQLFDNQFTPMPERAFKAVAHAIDLGVPPHALTTVGPCGCIWALQTTFTSGSGDIVLDLCALHAVSRQQAKVERFGENVLARTARPPKLIVTSSVVCIGVATTGSHQCPGYVINGADGRTYCQCSCESCLTAQRYTLLPLGMAVGEACITYGKSDAPHFRCEVTVEPISNITGRLPRVCGCDCRECKRAWWSDGRPVVRDGKIVREGSIVRTTASDVARREELRSSVARFSASARRTPEMLARIRKESLSLVSPDFTDFNGFFTCDNCVSAPTCAYVFDAYNTNGDCLAEK